MPQKTLNLSFGTYPISPFHPKAPAYQRLTFTCAVQGQLLSINPDMSFSAGLLKSVRRKDHGKTYELELQEDLVFHNGRKVDAEDLEFSLLRPALLPTRPALCEYLTAIKGMDEISPGSKFQSGMASGIRKINSKTLEIHLDSLFPSPLWALTRSTLSLYPLEELSDDYSQWKKHPVGAGAFSFLETGDGKTRIERSNTTSKRDLNFDILCFEEHVSDSTDVIFGSIRPKGWEDFECFVSDVPRGLLFLEFDDKNPDVKDFQFRSDIREQLQQSLDTASMHSFVTRTQSALCSHLPNGNMGYKRSNTPLQARKNVCLQGAMPVYEGFDDKLKQHAGCENQAKSKCAALRKE